MLDLNALPRKGKLNQIERKREESEDFKFARRQHPAVESAINNLEQRGLDRVRTRGADGFSRTVALSILALNLHWAAATGAAATTTRSLILFLIVPFRLAQLAFCARNLEIGSVVGRKWPIRAEYLHI